MSMIGFGALFLVALLVFVVGVYWVLPKAGRQWFWFFFAITSLGYTLYFIWKGQWDKALNDGFWTLVFGLLFWWVRKKAAPDSPSN